MLWCSVLGTPTEVDWAGVTSYIGWEEELDALDYNFTSKDLQLEALKAKVPTLDEEGMDLLSVNFIDHGWVLFYVNMLTCLEYSWEELVLVVC